MYAFPSSSVISKYSFIGSLFNTSNAALRFHFKFCPLYGTSLTFKFHISSLYFVFLPYTFSLPYDSVSNDVFFNNFGWFFQYVLYEGVSKSFRTDSIMK
jgi:hypothetical protein